ncbi:hypothetical protein [Paraburkholderia sp. A3RO-2L]|uniref:hypothetical protein n=1 Tax=unclassified Paraburkholderia TaxID=2615204 RepID=UPI003DA8336E
MKASILTSILAGASLAASLFAHAAEGPPTSNGIISNPTLVANQDVAKAQAVGAITTFMSQGAQECDANGKNCHSVFGQDDTPDYSGLQAQSQELTGISAFSYLGASGNSEDGGNSNAVASQLGTLAVACGDTSVKKVAGIAVKLTSCTVNTTGDAQITYQVCTAPSRQNPITPPKNAVPCSTDPSAPNFVAPEGKVCARPACDTEPLNSLDGWSAPQTVSWQATLPSNATADQQTNNGLGLTFYPNPTGGVLSLSTDADNMTAVKVIQTFIDNSTKKTAVGLKVAYRHQTQVTKDMMTQGPSSVPNPSANSAAWDTIEKLQGNALIPQYQQTYGANGADCLTQIQSGIGKDGKITVCDTNYTNESGIKPIAKTAQVAAEGEDCGTTPQCLNKVVNTQTWTEQCNADVPLAERNCSTTQDYTIDHMSYTRERSKEVCEEKRTNAVYGCQTTGGVGSQGCTPGQPCVVAQSCTPGQTYAVFNNNSGGMGSDGCDGGDSISATWTCPSDPTQIPNITISTNSKYFGTVGATLANGQESVQYISTRNSCYGKFINHTNCVAGQCSGTYEMHLGTMVCPVQENCTTTTTGGDHGHDVTTCTCPTATVFQEQSFGSSSSIVVNASFSMALMYSVNVSDACSPYEAAR